MKSFAAGTIGKAEKDEQKLEASRKKQKRNPPPSDFMNVRRHDMTTWFGCSGGLIGMLKEDEKRGIYPVIIGFGKLLACPFKHE